MDVAEVHKVLSALKGTIGFYYKDLTAGDEIRFQETVPVNAASVIKLFVMTAVFLEQERGHLRLDEKIEIHPKDKMPSCGVITYLNGHSSYTIEDLTTLMIIVSDNTAANKLIDRVGIPVINQMLDEFQMPITRIRRKLFDEKLSAQGVQNTVCAAETGRLLEKIFCKKCISPEASEKMMNILKNQRLNGKIPFYLKEKGIQSAHKTGEDDEITHDAGILFAKTPRIFCFLSEKTQVPETEKAIQNLAFMACK